jgi:uncharacterized protein YkwD
MTNMFWSLILLSSVVACGDGFDKKAKTGRTQESQEDGSFSINQQYLQMVNEYRISKQLRPLTYQPIIEEIALGHSKGMGLHVRPFGHMGFSVRCRRLRNRLGKVLLCGEIVAMGQKNIKEVFKAWITSPKHREELEHPLYTHTGLGIYKDERGLGYWTQMFVEL